MDRTPADRPDQPGAADRFNEDQATYAVRGEGAPDLEAGVAAIREVLKTLPVRPGVYRMQDARGDVLYVGKARTLRNRVTNYTQVTRLPKRLQRMVSQTRSMTIVTTQTEAEALFRPIFRQSIAAVPAVPDQALLGAVRRSHQRARLWRTCRRREELPRWT